MLSISTCNNKNKNSYFLFLAFVRKVYHFDIHVAQQVIHCRYVKEHCRMSSAFYGVISCKVFLLAHFWQMRFTGSKLCLPRWYMLQNEFYKFYVLPKLIASFVLNCVLPQLCFTPFNLHLLKTSLLHSFNVHSRCVEKGPLSYSCTNA